MKNSLSKKNIYLKNISEYLVLWAVGGCIYYGIEVLFRGFSHISMFMLGGLCMQFFTWQGRLTNWQDTLPRQIGKETIGVGVNEKAVLRFYQTALSFTSISIFPW